MNKTKCIIFGGGGFIGSHLTERLVEKNFSVIVFARGSKREYDNLNRVVDKIDFIKGDFNNINLISKVINPGDIVFDLIASSVPFSSMQMPDEEINNHISPHFQLIQLACKKKAKKIVFFSSGGGVYGQKSKSPISEEKFLQPASPHAISKITIEYFLNYFSKIYDTPYIIYRLSNPYGPRQIPKKGFGIIPTLFSHVSQNKSPTLFDNGKLIRDFIYIDDVINAILVSFNKKTEHHIYNIGSGKGITIQVLWEEIKKITKTDINTIFMEKRPIDTDVVVLSIRRLEEEFGWKPKTELSVGLKRTWNAHADKSRSKR